MRHVRAATGLVLFISLVAGVLSLSVLSWADDSNGSPQRCTKAKTKVEKLICENGQLRNYDRELTAFYVALLKAVEPSAKPDLVQSEKKWIAEREQCGITAKTVEELVICVFNKIHHRIDRIRKRIQETAAEKRLSEFAEFKLKTFKGRTFEFQFPSSWLLGKMEDGGISLKSEPQEMTLGIDKTVTSRKECTYKEPGTSEDDIRKFFYTGKVQIRGQEFATFHRIWIPSGEARIYYGFFNGHCFTIGVSDNSYSLRKCGNIDDGKDRADCEIAELEARDLMAYAGGVIRTIRFLHDQK
jgi:uncharacterized protein YecT (DUF1311 family)